MKELKLQKIAFYGVLLLMTLIYIGPFLFSLSISFNAEQDVFSWPIKLIPDELTLDNYRRVWTDLPFGQWLFNSVLIIALRKRANSRVSYAYNSVTIVSRIALEVSSKCFVL